jgi:hypothetical protein
MAGENAYESLPKLATFCAHISTFAGDAERELAPVRRFRCESVRDLGQGVIVTKTWDLAADRKGRQPQSGSSGSPVPPGKRGEPLHNGRNCSILLPIGA